MNTCLRQRVVLQILTLVAFILPASRGLTDEPDLRLVPYPRQLDVQPGNFSLNRRLLLEVSQAQVRILGEQVSLELVRAGYPAPTVRPLKTSQQVLRLSTRPRVALRKLPLRDAANPEEYALQIQSNGATVYASGAPGLYYGAQTLRQLIRANRRDHALPNLTIADWPSLRWRAFQDDLTRGPSSTLTNLQEQVTLGSELKLNLFTYYMEHQFAFQKHPLIGPKNGSLTPGELQALVVFAQPLQMNILGNQQSFGHFTSILAHPKYAALRETPHLLCPTNPRTYQLLDDLYGEVVPSLPFPYFNACCDETEGLGQGPAKATAETIGVGALYVEHIRRVHDLLAKRGKRMMMWGDIILRHPDALSKIPKDTVMLTWSYEPREEYAGQIQPFAKAGYEFFVCPGVSGWNRVLPQFGSAATNIHHFVRDGLKLGASGMINTAWDDDGESLNAPNWYGFAWGAECAWTGSATARGDFDRRIGALFFGESGEHFGKAIQALSLPDIEGVPNRSFWHFDFGPTKLRSVDGARTHWEDLLRPVRAAIRDLTACQADATIHRDLLDFFLFGARRIELCFQRELDRLNAAVAYRNARRLPLAQALPLLQEAETALRSGRDAHERLCRTFAELWNRENKPYALDWTLDRYRAMIRKYDAELDRLAQIRLEAKPDRSLPTPREAGLELVEGGR